jgi:hypothetical protein
MSLSLEHSSLHAISEAIVVDKDTITHRKAVIWQR